MPVALIVFASLGAGAAVGGCGEDSAATRAAAVHASANAPQAVDRLRRHPRAVEPSAGVPVDASEAGARTSGSTLPQPRSDAEIRRELAASGIPSGPRAALTSDGLAIAPLGAPAVVQEVIAAGNQIARLPYRYGGGHQTWVDTAYDCSASIGFTFAAAGLISSPMVSGALASWGESGPGAWITIYANGGHTFMTVAGLRFDTSGLSTTGSRWQSGSRGSDGFAVRHPPGL